MKHINFLSARLALAAASSVLLPASMGAQQQSKPAPMSPPPGPIPQFKVRLDFNRWHDVAELKSDFEKLARRGQDVEAVVARQEPTAAATSSS